MNQIEKDRLAELQALEILDTPAEAMFDEITRLAADICDTPIAAISLVDRDRQWFKSRIGLKVSETARDVAFCHHAIQQADIFEIEDAAKDPRFAANPLVLEDPRIRFYAGKPLLGRGGHRPGTLCVIDYTPRQLTPDQTRALDVLANQASRLLELRRLSIQQRREALFAKAMVEHTAAGLIATDLGGIITHCNPAATELLGYSAEEIVGRYTPEKWHIPEEVYDRARELSSTYGQEVPPGLDVFTFEANKNIHRTRRWTFRRANGTTFIAELSVRALRDSNDQQIGYLGVFTDRTETVSAQAALRESRDHLAEVAEHAESQRLLLSQVLGILETFISEPDTKKAFDEILQVLLGSTASEYGFIGEVLHTEDNTPFLKTHALTNIAWNKETRDFYDANAPQGMVFTNLKTLFGHVMAHRKMVIANSPYTDPRRGGLPPGHPPLNAFLGIPILSGDDLVGMVGVANREGGYDEDVAMSIQPLLATYGHLIEARRDRLRREEAEKSLAQNRAQLEKVFEASGLASFVWDIQGGEFSLGGHWHAIAQLANCNASMPLEDWLARVHLDDRDRVKANLEACVRGETPRWLAEYRVIADEDKWRWLRTESAVTDVDEEGMPLTISGTLRDIHDKHTLEAQARQLEADRTMIQEVHHRVKNNLQIVSSLLSFQQNRAEDESVAREFEVTRNRVAAVASLHETLYRSDTLKSVRMGALLHDLTRDIRQSYGIVGSQLVLDAGSSEVMIPFDMAGPCALVVNEWVTNAIKHAFADGPIGEIRVELDCQNEDQMVQVRVRDNGEGMKPKSERRSGSLGLKLVQRLSSQLEGTAEMLPSEQGTCWSLKFPVTP